MSGKIIVIGGNQTGLAFSIFSARKGFDVTLYEAKAENDVSYPWTDDMVPKTYSDVGLPLPPKEIFTRTRCLTFIPPSRTKLDIPQKEEELDINVNRRELNKWLKGLAEDAGAKVIYNTNVQNVIIKEDEVKGVILADGTEVFADLVVDCSGVNSKIRASLPDSFKITKNVSPNEKFFVRRAFYKRPDDVPFPPHPKEIYLKHLGEQGISWCFTCRDDVTADVLIGRLTKLTNETYQNALSDLKKDNPQIGEHIREGDTVYEIPVRRPIPRLFATGYALLGDSACMTIPMIGSGMASGLVAGKILADTISNGAKKPFSKENLYIFEYRFMKKMGAVHAGIDYIKNWFLLGDEKDITNIVNSGILEGMIFMIGGSSPLRLLGAIIKLMFTKPLLFMRLIATLLRVVSIIINGLRIPKHYNEKKLTKWTNKYEKHFNK